MLSELGLTVTRQIPIEMIGGILSGAYTAHGGVIRNGAGQIVAHLASASSAGLTSLVPGVSVLSSALANGQLMMLSRSVEELHSAVSSVMTAAATGAALSGLGLVVSVAGFAYLNRRFEQMEKLLVDVKDMIETRNIADLKSAIGHMKNAEGIVRISEENRRSLLLEAQRNFTTLSHLYGDLWARAKTTKQIRAMEGFFALAFTGASITNSELGMYEIAVTQYQENVDYWNKTARSQVRQHLIRDNPKQLQEISAELLPTADLVNVLDFANTSNRGIAWLDDFRMPDTKSWWPSIPRISNPWETADVEMVDLAKLWQKRQAVLQSQVAHLGFLSGKEISVGQFSKALKDAANAQGAEAICVIESQKKAG